LQLPGKAPPDRQEVAKRHHLAGFFMLTLARIVSRQRAGCKWPCVGPAAADAPAAALGLVQARRSAAWNVSRFPNAIRLCDGPPCLTTLPLL
jgi:hypothetical protein